METKAALRRAEEKAGAVRTVSDNLYVVLRIAVVLSVVILLIPSFNPARVSEIINRNMSLFTTGVDYAQLTSGFGKAFRKEWIDASVLKGLMYSCLTCSLGIVLQATAACATLGTYRLRRIGTKGTLAGSMITAAGLAGVYRAHQMFEQAENADKLKVVMQSEFYVLFIISILILLISFGMILSGRKAEKTEKLEIAPKFQLFLMALPFIAMAILFGYLPLLGWRYAFFDYKAGEALTAENFVGFKWFVYLFQNEATRKDILRVMKNTLGMSGLGLLTSWVSMAFAIFLNEIKHPKFRRFIQTVTTIPNFISWVLIFAVALSIFSADGFISNFMVNMGWWETGKNMLMNNDHVWLQMLLWGMWKGVGWGAIVYIAAISGIDEGLYEAAEVDGAGRFRKMWHITLPELMPTYCVLLLLSIGNILSNGLDQYLVFENSVNTSTIQVLDLYVYSLGVGKGLIPLTTAVGMLKSVISIVLVLAANKIAKLVRGENII